MGAAPDQCEDLTSPGPWRVINTGLRPGMLPAALSQELGDKGLCFSHKETEAQSFNDVLRALHTCVHSGPRLTPRSPRTTEPRDQEVRSVTRTSLKKEPASPLGSNTGPHTLSPTAEAAQDRPARHSHSLVPRSWGRVQQASHCYGAGFIRSTAPRLSGCHSGEAAFSKQGRAL